MRATKIMRPPIRGPLAPVPAAATLTAFERSVTLAIAAVPSVATIGSALSASVVGLRSLTFAILRWYLTFTVIQTARRLQKQSARSLSEREVAVDVVDRSHAVHRSLVARRV